MSKRVLNVLIACEYSDIVGREFRALGHNVTSCDLRPSEGSPNHFQGDIREMLGREWDVVIAFSPCTRKTLSGVRWLHERNLWADLDAECVLFNQIGAMDCASIARENSQPHRYAVERVGQYSQRFEVRQFGEPQKKAVCLWLKGLPALVTLPRDRWIPKADCSERVWRMGPSPNREKERSRFFVPVAKAMASQWSEFLCKS